MSENDTDSWRWLAAIEQGINPFVAKWVLIAAVVLAGMLGLLRIYNVSVHGKGGTDFNGFHRGAAALVQTGALSEDKAVRRYPPTFQVLIAPLALLPMAPAGVLWMTLNVLAVLGLPGLMARLSGVPAAKQWPAWLLMAPFIGDNLALGQNGPMLLWLVSAGLVAAKEKRAVVGGVLLGFAGLIKIIPIVLAGPCLFLRRTARCSAGIAAALLVGVFATVAALGPHAAWEETASWFHEVRQEQSAWSLIESGRSIRYNNQGLAVTIARTLGPVDPRKAKGAVRIASWPFAVSWTLYGGICAAGAAAWLAAAIRCRRRRLPGSWSGLYGLSAPLMLAASPLVWTHYFIWLFPTAVFLSRRRKLLVLLSIASLIALGIRPARALGFHMWLSLSLFVAVLADLWGRPGTVASQGLSRHATAQPQFDKCGDSHLS